MKKLPAALLVALLVSSCGGKKENPEARALLDNASQAYSSADYTLALTLLDSLQKAYPAEISLQKDAMRLRPQVIEKQTLLQISTNDSLTALDRVTAEKLKPSLKWVKDPRMVESYWVAADAYSSTFMNSTGIQGRVSEIGEFYIISSAVPAISHTSVTLSDGSASVSTPAVPFDGESNYRSGGGEVITFSPLQSDTIGRFAADAAASSRPLTLTLNGKQAKKVKLTSAQVKAIADAYNYASAISRARELYATRQKLEATLQVARNQIARTADLPEEPDQDSPDKKI